MKTALLLGALVLFFSFESSAQNRDIDAIKKLNRDWLNSLPKRDSSTLRKILADDFILIAPNGSKQTKADNLSMLLSPDIETKSVNIDNVEVRLLTPEVGMLNAWITFVYKANGKEITGKNSYQDIYMKRKNRWVAVSAHVTSLSIH